jgi:hypothetical protein
MENEEWPAGVGSAIAIHCRGTCTDFRADATSCLVVSATTESGVILRCNEAPSWPITTSVEAERTVAFASRRMPRGSLVARRTAMFTQDWGRHGIHAHNGVTKAASDARSWAGSRHLAGACLLRLWRVELIETEFERGRSRDDIVLHVNPNTDSKHKCLHERYVFGRRDDRRRYEASAWYPSHREL